MEDLTYRADYKETKTWEEMGNFDRGMWTLFDIICWIVKGLFGIITSPIWILGYFANKRRGG